jgi:N-acetylmuramoyl-L-alanine amidase
MLMKSSNRLSYVLLLFISLTITLGLTALQHIGIANANSPESFLLPEIKTDHPVVTNVDVLLVVGHGGIDGGTSFGNLLEKDINLSIAKKTYDSLQKKGFVVLMNRMDDYALSGENLWLHSRSRHLKDLSQRSNLANEIKPKVMISLHVNSARRSSKTGPLLLHQKSEQSLMLAKSIQNYLNMLYGTHEEPVYGKTYYLLKHTVVPSVIVEMGFITNVEDRKMLTQTASQQEIADRIAEGIQQYIKNSL